MKNRVIKFRAWDDETKEMFSWEQIGKLDGCTGSWCYTSNPNWILMQFTGLTDKNGKEIYESDINQDGGVVIWNNDDASFCWHYEGVETQPFGEESDWCEIKGNLYESDKLLNN